MIIAKLFPKGSFLPVVVDRAEAFFLRLGTVFITFWSIWEPMKYDRMEKPAGIARWIDLTFLGRPGAHTWLLIFAGIGALVYFIGLWKSARWTLLGLLPLTLAHLGYWTLRNSQANTFHGSNLTTMVLLWQLGAAGIQCYRDQRGTPNSQRWTGLDGMLLYASQCVIAGAYVASGLTKLGRTKGRWPLDSHLFAKSVQKVWRQHYFDDPTAPTYSGESPWAQWLLHNPVGARLMFTPGFFLECFAFLMLANRCWALAIGAGLVAMHFFVEMVMQLEFPEWQALSLVFAMNIPFWIAWKFKRKPEPSGAAQ